MRGVHALLHRRIREGHKWNHVRRPNAGMHPRMAPQIDRFRRASHSANRPSSTRLRRSGERHHAAIVITIHLPTEQQDSMNAADRADNRPHDFLVAPFGKIGNTFDHTV